VRNLGVRVHPPGVHFEIFLSIITVFYYRTMDGSERLPIERHVGLNPDIYSVKYGAAVII
jgi:hypothetical protein